MGFVAEVQLVSEDLALVPTIEAGPDVTIRYEYETDGGERLLFVSVFGDEWSAVESAMAADHTVSDPTRVATFANRVVYRVVVDTDLELVPQCCSERGLFVLERTSDGRGWLARIHVPTRDVLSSFRTYCREHGISFRVTQLRESTATDDDTYILTERQRKILSMAYYAGYYDIPRRVSQGDLAEQLDVSTSAVSQRLRRAVSSLIATTLEHDHTRSDSD